MINLDYQSRTPIYEQIVFEVERYVVLGILKPKEQLPSIRDLANTLGINPNTVKKAYSELENKGVLITISTKGTFITDSIASIVNKKIDEKIRRYKKYHLWIRKNGVYKRRNSKKNMILKQLQI